MVLRRSFGILLLVLACGVQREAGEKEVVQMSKAKLVNGGFSAFPMPYPLSGIVGIGEIAVVSKTAAELIELCGGTAQVIKLNLQITDVAASTPTTGHDTQATARTDIEEVEGQIAGINGIRQVEVVVTLADLQAAEGNACLEATAALPAGASLVGAEIEVVQEIAAPDLDRAFIGLYAGAVPSSQVFIGEMRLYEMGVGTPVGKYTGMRTTATTDGYTPEAGYPMSTAISGKEVTVRVVIRDAMDPLPINTATAGSFKVRVYYVVATVAP